MGLKFADDHHPMIGMARGQPGRTTGLDRLGFFSHSDTVTLAAPRPGLAHPAPGETEDRRGANDGRRSAGHNT